MEKVRARALISFLPNGKICSEYFSLSFKILFIYWHTERVGVGGEGELETVKESGKGQRGEGKRVWGEGERDREREGGRSERERERITVWLPAQLDPMTLRSWTELKSRVWCSTDWATQLSLCMLILFQWSCYNFFMICHEIERKI